MNALRRVEDALHRVTAALPRAEERPGQVRMAEAVAAAVATKRHLIVQAGTGTGKTLAYLVPTILAGERAVVATATKALQDQLGAKDLPFLQAHLGQPFRWSVVKGRGNYVCLQRLRELADPAQGQLEIDVLSRPGQSEVRKLVAWAATTQTGDQAELDWTPSDAAWRSVSVSGDECPGASRCPMGGPCFAEQARLRAGESDVVVTNLHLYGLDVATDGGILPEHRVVVIDEAHQTEDIMTDAIAIELSAWRLGRVVASVRSVIDDPALHARLSDVAAGLVAAIAPLTGQRLPWPVPDGVQAALVDVRAQFAAALEALRRAADTLGDDRAGRGVPSAAELDSKQRVIRAQQMTGILIEQIDGALRGAGDAVPYVSGTTGVPRLEVAPLDIAPTLAAGIWERRTAVLTSATIPTSLAGRLGIANHEQLDVGSPFDFAANGLLYCALHLPDPRHATFAAASHDELAALIAAAGGRTLALFTSWKAMDAAAEALRGRVQVPIVTQRDLPKTALVRRFSEDEATCLFATAGFFQGVDIPGRTLSLVAIDRIPFPRPDDPLLSARRELVGATAFAEIDVPRASMLLAQATGRLIRTSTDRGVVAVLDRRLGTAGYRWDIVRALPPLRRTRHRAEAEAFLRRIAAEAGDTVAVDGGP